LHLFDIRHLAAQCTQQFALVPLADVCGQDLPDLIQRKAGPLCTNDDTQNNERVGRVLAVSIGLSGNCREQPLGLIKSNA
jgi:hypothetical protein